MSSNHENKNQYSEAISFDEFDDINYPREEDSNFSQILDSNLSRRDFFKNSVKVGLVPFLISIGAYDVSAGRAILSRTKKNSKNALDFVALDSSVADTVVVPEGFAWDVLVSWGEPLWSKGVAFDEYSGGTGESQELAFGDNNDGMAFFTTDQDRYLLAVNNEYTNQGILYGNRISRKAETADDVRKGKAAHGVSVMELKQVQGKWKVVKDSPYNRRITADTPMDITGPLRGYSKLKTAADLSGVESLGTWNNCGSGRTPWGTFLTCEENFNGYFSSSNPNYEPSTEMHRYGIGNIDYRGYDWARFDERFDISKHPNEPNRAGYVVEIDPADPKSKPRKLTALGRFKHENAEVVIAKDNRVVVYMGDDERGEYLYRFVSHGKYSSASSTNGDLLTSGTLYAAKFYANGKGEWLALTPETTEMSSEDICLYTRLASSAVRATTMDRPEWISASPDDSQVMCCLTNNKNRGIKRNKGGDATPVSGPNPRRNNLYGQIVRWRPKDKDHTHKSFSWDLFAMAGNPTVHQDARSGSANISPENMFNSPDGLAFDRNGYLWILTDGKYSNTGDFSGMGNNQMLVGNTQTGEIKRFLVGPKEAEITAITWSHDYKTAFVGVQHPGERGNSHFPNGGNSVPRSSVIAVSRKDGKAIV